MVNQHVTSEKENIERLITIPEDIKKVISGKKSATRRMKRFADVGEVMILEGQKFVIEKVYQQALGDITDEDAKKKVMRVLSPIRSQFYRSIQVCHGYLR